MMIKRELGWLIFAIVIGAIVGVCGAIYLRSGLGTVATRVEAKHSTSTAEEDVNWSSRVEI